MESSRRSIPMLARWSAVALIALSASRADARSIVVLGPHPDDETLIAAGRVRAALAAGDSVKIVVVTNGDLGGTADGYLREGESVAAAKVLGFSEQDVIFMGYGDQDMYNLWSSPSPTQIYRSAAGQTATYGNRGLGGMDWHRYRTGAPGPYNRATALDDFKALITTFGVDEIYTTSFFDDHGDHEATARFAREAILGLRASGVDVRTVLNESIVWAPNGGSCATGWPLTSAYGTVPFTKPTCLDQSTTFDWERARHYPVPAEMQVNDTATNLKYRAIEAYPSQFSDFLTAFVKKDEFFWRWDLAHDVAKSATLSVSSVCASCGGPAAQAIDGYADMFHEWIADEGAGAWIQLSWAAPVRVAQVNLYDRIDPNDNVLSGTLTFSDGSSIAVGALPTLGKPLPVVFPPKVVSWVRFTITKIAGNPTTGLAEIDVLGAPAASTENVAPFINRGPLASPPAINFTQTSTLTVEANDIEGDALSYEWTAPDGGSIQGAGATAVFTPPAVASDTVFTIQVRVTDGHGGADVNSAFVTVSAAAVNALTISPTSVTAGATATGTVLLSSAAPSGGLVVPLTSSDPTIAAVPATVTVPSGRTSATFTIATGSVSAPTQVFIDAAFGAQTQTAALTVTPPAPPALSAVTLSPSSAVGGNPVQVTVTLTSAAPAQGVTVLLTSSAPTLAPVPASVSVPSGQTSTSLSISTAVVASTTPVTIAGTDGTATAQATLTLSPLQVASLSLAPATVTGGSQSTATVSLNGLAPAGGATVSLSSADSTLASVQPTVLVPAGATSASFPVYTSAVSVSSAVAISGSLAGTTKTATLTINPPALSTLTLSPTSVTAGGTATGTITLAAAAPSAGVAVALTSSNPAVASVPASIVVAGGSTTATFTVSTSSVTAATTVTISGSLGGVTQSATLSVKLIAMSKIALSPTSVVGSVSSTGTVTLTGPAPADTFVSLASSNTAAATVPATVLVPAGSATGTFPITTSVVTVATSSSISASYGGVKKSATLSVKVLAASALSLSPNSVQGGGGTAGTVTLNAPAPAGGFPVALAASSAIATVPGTVTVPEGSKTVGVPITTTAVTANTTVTISATAGGVTRSANLTVTLKPAVLSVVLVPSTVSSGGASLGTVTLNAPAAATGTSVTVTSSNTAAATVTSPLTVPAGQTSATFTVSAATVTASTAVTISCATGGVTKRATLTVNP